ncbi:MAG: hypothetical protein U1E64_06245 [Sphingomonadaceae bacterium]
MKFEGPTPETETRQVSISFAAFIIVCAFALFGIAMAIGTVTGLQSPQTEQPQVTQPEPGFESAPTPAPLPAVTQPDPTAMTATDPANPEQADADTPFAAELAAAAKAASAPPAPPAVVATPAPAPAPAAKAPASETAQPAQPAVQTHNPSFPTRHVAPVVTAAPAQPAPTN